MQAAHCPECDLRIVLNPAKVGQSLTCPRCDVYLEVVGVEPLEFDWGYDWSWEETEIDEQQAEYGAPCPECERVIVLGSPPVPRQKLTCLYCHADLEVCCTEPLVFDHLYAWNAENWEEQAPLMEGGPG